MGIGKKMKLPMLSCHQPRTLSFRTQNDAAFKTINAAYLDTSDSGSFSTASELDEECSASLETVIRSLRSDRLFFEPDQTSSILEAKTTTVTTSSLPFKDTLLLSVDSQDPYVDFRKSMEEMVEARCVKDWEGLQDLFCCYLKVNAKTNHGYIVRAFVDFFLASSSSLPSLSPSSPSSFYSSSISSSCSTRCVSCLEADDDLHNHIPPASSLLLHQVREDHPSSSSSSFN
ncbi:hypothetical protein Fmac_006563 [Flemingia macrophylla]|uniref:Transcription repressor n=1 Tax=Flemingia macrophylla TaxID=520843 RepID=A0ABD1NBG1_9FABA